VKPEIRACADALWDARARLTPVPPLRSWLEPGALADAYAVQSLNTARRLSNGARRIGRKIGLTSAAVQK
jgi:2-keto-4-pentenoate hydratase